MNPQNLFQRCLTALRSAAPLLKTALLPVGAAVVTVVLVLNLGLVNNFKLAGYLGQGGFAVPENTVSRLLRSGAGEDSVALLKVDLGDPLYTRGLNGDKLYVGEDQEGLGRSYPIYTQSGTVLYFVDSGAKMVTDRWETLEAYAGLFLSDGQTFNADRTQADEDGVLLVQVEGGYQVAQETTVTHEGQQTVLPMNTVCAFGKDKITYFTYINGVMYGDDTAVSEEATITIGDTTLSYGDFLKNLGLWEEERVVPDTDRDENGDDSESGEQSGVGDNGNNTGEDEGDDAGNDSGDESDSVGGNTGEATDKEEGDKRPPTGEGKVPEGPSDDLETPEDAIPNPDATPAPPAPGGTTDNPNVKPDYQDPTVEFGKTISPWVYTLSIDARISDPAHVMDSAVSVRAYEVYEDGTEAGSAATRRMVASSGTVILSNLRPATKYHLVAEYEYTDKLNYPRTVQLDLGYGTTEAFETLAPIKISYRDVLASAAPGQAAVELYPDRIQLRELVLGNVANGESAVVGEISTNSLRQNLLSAENYITNFQFVNMDAAGKSLSVDAGALRLLKAGYCLTYWNSAPEQKSDLSMRYEVRLLDRFGNRFEVEDPDGIVDGQTCKVAPTVEITAPNEKNIPGSTQINVIWRNPDRAAIAKSPAEKPVMGQEKAGLFLVPKGREFSPHNAIDLTGYLTQDKEKTEYAGKFLPISVDSSPTVTTVTTSWTITGLIEQGSYRVGVLVGSYDVEDQRDYVEVTVEEPTDLLTGSIANLGDISYRTEVDQIGYNEARLKLSMNKVNSDLLLHYLGQLNMTLVQNGDDSNRTLLTLNKQELAQATFNIADAVDGQEQVGRDTVPVKTVTVPVKAYLDGKETPYWVPVTLVWEEFPDMSFLENRELSVWNFLLATARTDNADICWVTLPLGARVENTVEGEGAAWLGQLYAKTGYTGTFRTLAVQANIEVDVSSQSNNRFIFNTISQQAMVEMDYAFVSADFIELYGVEVTDPDACVLPDDGDRGGAIGIRIVNSSGVQVAVDYIDPGQRYEKRRIEGLERDQTYTMYFTAMKYNNGSSIDIRRDLQYTHLVEEGAEEPTKYTFTTGVSVSGELNLLNVSQLYRDEDGTMTSNLSLLTEDDFYFGVWQDGYVLRYYDGVKEPVAEGESSDFVSDDTVIERYREQVLEKELPQFRDIALAPEGAKHPQIITQKGTVYSTNTTWHRLLQTSWTTRMIPVKTGEIYSIVNTYNAGNLRISFYEQDKDGNVRYRGLNYSDGNYLNGGFFRVPEPTNSNYTICAMRISNTDERVRDGMILVKYDEKKVAGLPDLSEGVEIAPNMLLGNTGGLSVNTTYGYTTDFIPVTGGSIYVLGGRNPNRPVSQSGFMDNNTGYTSNSYVLFYSADRTFLGSQSIADQMALVKAPFGAAYCRFNVHMKQGANAGQTSVDTSELVFKPYCEALQSQYVSSIQVKLNDNSDAEHQLMHVRDTFKVTTYVSETQASDTTDLSALKYVGYGLPQQYVLGEQHFSEGKLAVDEVIHFNQLEPNRAYMAELSITVPLGDDRVQDILLATLYYTTNRVVYVIDDVNKLLNMRLDPAGSYIVTEDIPDLTDQVLGGDRPFTGVIDFQGHTVTTTNVNGLFSRISASGVVKNLVLEYKPTDHSRTDGFSSVGAVAHTNYGNIQNVVVRYDPDYPNAPYDMRYSGGICRYNYGAIDSFVVEISRDLRVREYFGGVVSQNWGSITNGYVYGGKNDNGTTASIISTPFNAAGEVASATADSNAWVAGRSYASGLVNHVFVVGDLIIESESAFSEDHNADVQNFSFDGIKETEKVNASYETSRTSTGTSALLVGYNAGQAANSFTVGDRIDRQYNSNITAYMLHRGPAIGGVGGRYEVDNITYFSNAPVPYSQKTYGNAEIGRFNVRGEKQSLRDYQWHEYTLGAEASGGAFQVREQVEQGFYPRLKLPACFSRDDQPTLLLPGSNEGTMNILSNEVRLQGVDSALVTLSLDFPSGDTDKISQVTIVEETSGRELTCEVVGQRQVDNICRVDVLVSIERDDEGKYLDNCVSSYLVNGIGWSGGYADFSNHPAAGGRMINAQFFKPIYDKNDWMTYFASKSTSGITIRENYILMADLDFSEDQTNTWYSGAVFSGTLDGGIYAIEEVGLTDNAGNPIYEAGTSTQRTIAVRGALEGMHTISGAGNVTQVYDGESGRWTYDWPGADTNKYPRETAEYRSSLIYQLKGTLQNLVFERFVTVQNPESERITAVNSYYGGVVCLGSAGAVLDNCHVRDSVFSGRYAVGGLVANASGTTLRNCSVGDTTVQSFRKDQTTSDTVHLGGLVGTANSCQVETCFAANVQVKAADVYASGGFGGLVGNCSATIINDCYSTGLVDASASYVGGIAGRMSSDTSQITGCWTTAYLMTTTDYAGGIVGQYSDGVLSNNYTASTVMTRSMAATFVHRIASDATFAEGKRFNNYAFANQYLTYLDDSGYQFGVWDELDGATRLLELKDLQQSATWRNEIGVGSGYDLDGSAYRGPLSGMTMETGLAETVMPKLKMADGQLLYDQPEEVLGYQSESRLHIIRSNMADTDNEQFTVEMALFNDTTATKQNHAEIKACFDTLALWSELGLIGGEASLNRESVQFYQDSGLDSRNGAYFTVTITYGDKAKEGHYLDSYVMSLPVYAADGSIETLQTRLSPKDTVYKVIYDMVDWDNFFTDKKYKNTYENVKIVWRQTAGYQNDGTIDFSRPAETESGEHAMNVRVNRLVGSAYNGKYPTVKNLAAYTTNMERMSLISQVITEVSCLNFEDITLTNRYYKDGAVTAYNGGTKGVVGTLYGSMDTVTFTNITIEANQGGYVGCIGRVEGDVTNVELSNIRVHGTGSYVGGLAGQTAKASTITDVRMDNTANRWDRYDPSASEKVLGDDLFHQDILDAEAGNIVSATHDSGNTGDRVGGLVGHLQGIGARLSVDNTHVVGRYLVGGAVGYAETNGDRVEEYKLADVTVGDPGKVSSEPGLLKKTVNNILTEDPNVVVTIKNPHGTSGVNSAGGAVGHGGNQRMTDIRVYNTKVECPEFSPDDNGGQGSGTYGYSVGGVVGNAGNTAANSLAKNCLVTSRGGFCGGLGGGSIGVDSVAQDCIVMGTDEEFGNRVGGAVGQGRAVEVTAQHCIVSGANEIGGVVGRSSDYIHRANAVDCVVLGQEYVGGIAGTNYYYYSYTGAVTDSKDDGTEENRNLHTTITLNESVVSPAARDLLAASGNVLRTNFSGRELTAPMVLGQTSVGGLYGQFCGVIADYHSVDSTVTVAGDTNVGGFAGTMYGWHANNWNTTRRTVMQNLIGAQVYGNTNVGGFYGFYTHSESADNLTVNGAYHPTAENTYNNVFTGKVVANVNNGHILVGNASGVGANDQENFHAQDWFGATRVWEGSTVNGVKPALEMLDSVQNNYLYYLKMYAAPPEGTTKEEWQKKYTDEAAKFKTPLAVTLDNLHDEYTYFGSGTMGGMGWSRYHWSDDTLQSLFPDKEAPASFEAYKEGIEQGSLVLWLDSRNNTGLGYTDESTQTWKDLSGENNDATLYWNGRSGLDTYPASERLTVMDWNDGALEFFGSNTNYKAQLAKSISGYLEDGYTVEIVYDYTSPGSYAGNSNMLQWRDGAFNGGFYSHYDMRNQDNGSTLIYAMNVNKDGTYGQRTRGFSADTTERSLGNSNRKTVSFAAGKIGENGASANNAMMTTYINGTQMGEAQNFRVTMPNNQWTETQWFLSSPYVRIYALRIYDKALSAEEAARNAAYDQWYYFGGDMPADATAQSGAGELSVGAELFRNDHASYNGTLVGTYTGVEDMQSRGYYYTRSDGTYSKIERVADTAYGPRQTNYDAHNSGTTYYYPSDVFLTGLEGTDSTGKLHNVNDKIYKGGFVLPASAEAGDNALYRWPYPTEPSASTLELGQENRQIPSLSVYASGADRVNLELIGDIPAGLTYEIRSDEGTVLLSGTWESRAITMTWDFTTPFTVALGCGEEVSESRWAREDIARTVMTFGEHWWYLNGGLAFGNGDLPESDAAFIHLMNGYALDEAGVLWSMEGQVADEVTAFTAVAATPLWSGLVDGALVETFGAYTVSATGQEQLGQMYIRDAVPYSVPPVAADAGSFVIDSYAGKYYATYLEDGELIDYGDSLVYPEGFVNSRIAEFSCNLHATGHTAVVRYTGGKLMAFNYLTGQVLAEVDVDATQAPSFFSFLWDALSFFGEEEDVATVGDGKLGVVYDLEVKNDPALQTALGTLSVHGNAPGDGTGVGDGDDKTPVGDYGDEVGDGAESDLPQNLPEGEAGIEGEITGEIGPAAGQDDPAVEGNGHHGQSGEPEEELPAAPAPGVMAPAVIDLGDLAVQYVAVQTENGETLVYDVAELLTVPTEELVSQNERAEQLSELGFHSTLNTQPPKPEPVAKGLGLMVATGAGTLAMLVVLAVVKLRKVDRRSRRH